MTSVTEPPEAQAEHQVDIHTTAGKLADLRKRAEETLHPVGEAAVEKVHAKGKLTARERIYALLDEGSFVELDALARHRSTNFGLADNYFRGRKLHFPEWAWLCQFDVDTASDDGTACRPHQGTAGHPGQ